MANIPSNLSYGTVTGRFILAYADSVDSGSEPDAIPAQGSIFFTPSPVYILDKTALDGSTLAPVTILPATVEATLDSSGYLCGYGTTRGVILTATSDDQGNNILPDNWTWTAEFRLTDADGTAVSRPSFSFSLPAGSSVDLTTLSPVPDSNGTFYTVGPAGPANSLSIGTVTTGAGGSSASATITGTAPTQTLNLTIPAGVDGADGTNGIDGIDGTNGTDGVDGLSAYEIAVANGYTDTEAAWLLSLVGPEGPQGEIGPQGETGPVGASIAIKGSVPTVGDLPATGNTENDAYIVDADGDLYVWDGSAWVNAGAIQGPAGAGVPTGGATHSFLVKTSVNDYDTQWSNVIDGGTA